MEYYVRIVRSLPVFEERAAWELLSRAATLGAKVACPGTPAGARCSLRIVRTPTRPSAADIWSWSAETSTKWSCSDEHPSS
ncbi:hypothetical protein [Streptomyces sp. NPDC001889]